MAVEQKSKLEALRASRNRSWIYRGVCVVVFAVMVGWGINHYSLRYCLGEYNTPQCKKDREERKARSYEQAKEQS